MSSPYATIITPIIDRAETLAEAIPTGLDQTEPDVELLVTLFRCDRLLAKQSAVNEQGALRRVPIEGLVLRPTRPVPHEDGHVTEVARASWGELADPIVQVHITRRPSAAGFAPGGFIRNRRTASSSSADW